MTEINFQELIINALPGIATAIIAAYLAALWSLRKLYSEKWWDKKDKAYAELIEALYDMIQYLEIKKRDYGDGAGYSEEKLSEFSTKYSNAYWMIKKATDIGYFRISKKAHKTLKELKARPQLDWEQNPPWDVYEQDYDYYSKALETIISIAKRDLRAGKV